MTVFTRAFWQYAADRAINSCTQGVVAMLTLGQVGILDVDWRATGSAAALLAILSVLTSLMTQTAPTRSNAPEPDASVEPTK